GPGGEGWAPASGVAGLPPVTARSILSQGSGVLPSAQQQLDRIITSIEKFERLGPKAERALEEIAQLARDARLFIPELKKTNDKLQNFIGPHPLVPGDGTAVFPPPGTQPDRRPGNQ